MRIAGNTGGNDTITLDAKDHHNFIEDKLRRMKEEGAQRSKR